MSRYLVTAPYHATGPEVWERIWQFDLENGVIFKVRLSIFLLAISLLGTSIFFFSMIF